jgi:hypothetical protein
VQPSGFLRLGDRGTGEGMTRQTTTLMANNVALIVPGYPIIQSSVFQSISPTEAISTNLTFVGTQIALSLTVPLPPDAALCVFWISKEKEPLLLGYLSNVHPSLIVSIPGSAFDEGISGQVGIAVEPLSMESTNQSDANTLVAMYVAKKILGSFFDYASGFAQTIMGKEVIPFKTLVDWQQRTEQRLKNDPSWLLRGFST